MRLPGFVDLQVNGYMGASFSASDLTEEAFVEACHKIFARGTAAFLPTVITSGIDAYRHVLPLIASVMARGEFADRLPGIHLEGPFISPKPGAVGAHDEDLVRTPDVACFDELMELAGGRVKLMTLASEIEGADVLAKHAVSRGVAVSLGHQLADGASLDRLARAGATGLTHLGNGIPNVLPRHPNAIWYGLADDRYTAMLITDGHHLPPEFIKTALRAKGIARTLVVSDAAPVAGMPPGKYTILGRNVVLEENGKLGDPVRGCLVGSASTMLECMNTLASLDLVPIDALMRLGRANPLGLIGLGDEVASDERLEYDEARRVFTPV